MEITFLVNMNQNQKTGLFNSTHKRIKSFKDKGIEVKVYTLNSDDSFLIRILKKIFRKKINLASNYFEYDGIQYNCLNLKNSMFKKIVSKINLGLGIKLSLSEIEKKIKIEDILVCHWGITSGIIGTHIGKKRGKKVFIVHHGSDIHTAPKKNSQLKKILLEKMSVVDGNIFVSQKLQKEAELMGHISKNNYVIYNGVDKNILIKDTSNEFKVWKKNKNYLVGFVGNLYWIKNADSLPEIFKKISDKIKNIQFLIIGDGEYRKEIEIKIKEKNLDVKFLGKIEPDEVSAYMKEMDLLIIPSRNEGLPLVCLEAKAIGLKTVASDVGGIKEALGKKNVVELDTDFVEKISNLAVYKLNNDENILLEDKFLWENIFKEEYKIYFGEDYKKEIC